MLHSFHVCNISSTWTGTEEQPYDSWLNDISVKFFWYLKSTELHAASLIRSHTFDIRGCAVHQQWCDFCVCRCVTVCVFQLCSQRTHTFPPCSLFPLHYSVSTSSIPPFVHPSIQAACLDSTPPPLLPPPLSTAQSSVGEKKTHVFAVIITKTRSVHTHTHRGKNHQCCSSESLGCQTQRNDN